MKRDRCNRSWELEALRQGRLATSDAASFDRHVRSCSTCAAAAREVEQIRQLGCALGGDDPGELRLRRLRGRVLRDAAASASKPRLRLGRRAGVGLAVATAALATWLVAGRPSAGPIVSATAVATIRQPALLQEPLAGAVVASSGARWAQTRTSTVERLRIDEGIVAVHVRPQSPQERFLVELPDGELEVRGTTFEVTVAGARTTRVHVDEGKVELRLVGEPVHVLIGGDTWPGSSVTSTPTPTPTPTPTTSTSTSTLSADAANQYAEAVRLLQVGENDRAATAFHACWVRYPSATQAEDASFLEAVALARSGRTDAAGLAAEHHLSSYPRSFHKGDAETLVARAATLRLR